jgi:hypothetical protein
MLLELDSTAVESIVCHTFEIWSNVFLSLQVKNTVRAVTDLTKSKQSLKIHL